MKPKQTLILGLAVAAALAAILAYEYVWKPRQQSKRAVATPLFAGLDAAQVAALELQKGDKLVRLLRQGDTWLVASENDYPADPDGVNKALETAQGLNTADLVSNKADAHALFEVDAEKGLAVKLLDAQGKALAEFVVGKRGESYGTAYFRPAGSDSTYLAVENLASVYDRFSDSWKDKAINRFEVAEVRELTIQGGAVSLTIVKNLEHDAWEQTSGGAKTLLDKAKVEAVVRGLGTLRTVEFPAAPPADAGLAAPARTVSAKLQDNSLVTIKVGKLDDTGNRYYVERADQTTLFLVAKYTVDALFPKPTDLLPSPEGEGGADANPIGLPPPPLQDQ